MNTSCRATPELSTAADYSHGVRDDSQGVHPWRAACATPVSMQLQAAQVLDIIERTTDTLAGDRRMHAEWRQSAVLGSAVDETSRCIFLHGPPPVDA